MNFLSVQRLRESYPEFSEFNDDFKTSFDLTVVDVRIESDWIRCQFHIDGRNIQMDYFKNQNGCMVSWYKNCVRTNKLLENQDYFGVAFEDIQDVLKKRFNETLSVFSMDYQGNPNNVELVNTSQQSLLDLIKPKIQVETFQTTVANPLHVLEVLQHLDPDFLKILKITSVNGTLKRGDVDSLDMEEIVKMDQWKRAREVSISNMWIQIPIQNLFHFERVDVAFKELTSEMIVDLKEARYLGLKIIVCDFADLRDFLSYGKVRNSL